MSSANIVLYRERRENHSYDVLTPSLTQLKNKLMLQGNKGLHLGIRNSALFSPNLFFQEPHPRALFLFLLGGNRWQLITRVLASGKHPFITSQHKDHTRWGFNRPVSLGPFWWPCGEGAETRLELQGREGLRVARTRVQPRRDRKLNSQRDGCGCGYGGGGAVEDVQVSTCLLQFLTALPPPHFFAF